MIPLHWKPGFLVFVQFLCLGYVAATGPIIPSNILLILAGFICLIPGGWALLVMPRGTFQVSPRVRSNARLIKNRGPYRLIRHPMYTSVISVTLVLCIAETQVTRWLFWVLLCINMWLKMNLEESFLRGRFEEYALYCKKTTRLLPFVL